MLCWWIWTVRLLFLQGLYFSSWLWIVLLFACSLGVVGTQLRLAYYSPATGNCESEQASQYFFFVLPLSNLDCKQQRWIVIYPSQSDFRNEKGDLGHLWEITWIQRAFSVFKCFVVLCLLMAKKLKVFQWLLTRSR